MSKAAYRERANLGPTVSETMTIIMVEGMEQADRHGARAVAERLYSDPQLCDEER